MSREDDNAAMQRAAMAIESYMADQPEIDEYGEISDKPYEAAKMKRQGKPLKQIAKTLGYNNVQAASRAITTYYQQAAVARGTQRREEDLQEAIEQVEMLYAPYAKAALQGDLASAQFALKCAQEIFKLKYLYEEQKSTNTMNYVVIQGSPTERVETLKRIVESTGKGLAQSSQMPDTPEEE